MVVYLKSVRMLVFLLTTHPLSDHDLSSWTFLEICNPMFHKMFYEAHMATILLLIQSHQSWLYSKKWIDFQASSLDVWIDGSEFQSLLLLLVLSNRKPWVHRICHLSTINYRIYLWLQQTVQIAFWSIFHHQIYLLFVIEVSIQLHNVGVLAFRLDYYFSLKLLFQSIFY